MLKRVALDFSSTRGYHVRLPTYTMMPGTFLPIIKGVIHADGAYPNAEPKDVLAVTPTVIVSIPDAYTLDSDGQLDKLAIIRTHEGHAIYGRYDYAPPRVYEYQPIVLTPTPPANFLEKAKRFFRGER